MVELLVVLSIVAVLSGLGLLGMNQFRMTSQMQTSVSELASDMLDYRNMARNSVASTKKPGTTPTERLVDGYAVFFENGNYSLHYCDRELNQTMRCEDTPNLIEKPSQLNGGDIEIEPQPADVGRCQGILFENRSGLIYSMSDYSAVPDDTGTCVYFIRHQVLQQQKLLVVDLQKNTLDIINENEF